jgi:hypothetical protein
MLHHIATISVCYGGHFESKMTAKLQKSSDLGEIWYYYKAAIHYGGYSYKVS